MQCSSACGRPITAHGRYGVFEDAVPAIGEALNSDETLPFKYVYVKALERIGDKRGAQSILDFVAAQSPYSDSDSSTLTALTILSLRATGDSSIAPLTKILQDESAHPRVRLACAATIAALDGTERRQEAVAHVYDAYENRRELGENTNEGVAESELFIALGEVNTPDSIAILLSLFETETSAYILIPAIDSLVRNGDDSVAAALGKLASDSDMHELHIRLHAAEALMGMPGVTSDLFSSELAQKLLDEARADQWSPDIVNRAAQLLAQSAPR